MPLTRRPITAVTRAMLASLLLMAACALCATLAEGAQAAGAGKIESLTPSRVPLTSITADPSNHLIYAQENEGTRFFSYNPETDEWTQLASAPINSGNNGGAAYLNGKVYTSYTVESASIGVYDIASNEWSTIANPLGQGTADIAAYEEDIYMVNGMLFVKYDPATASSTTLAAPAEAFSGWGGLQGYEGKIYGHVGDGSSGFEVYDIAEGKWSTLPSTPGGAVAGSALDPEGGGTYFAYGDYGEENLYAYDIATGTWSESKLPFEVGDGGMAYDAIPGIRGVYIPQGERGTGFVRYDTFQSEADLSLSESASTRSATVGSQIAYTIEVGNAGPEEAGAVRVVDPLPGNVSVISATSSEGSCRGVFKVTCQLGPMAPGGKAAVTITVRAESAGTATNAAEVVAAVLDPNLANNSAQVSTEVASVSTLPAAPLAVSCAVPSLQGMALSEVTKALEGAHCGLGQVVYLHSSVAKGRLFSQDEAPGTILPGGSSVDVQLSLGPSAKKPKPKKPKKPKKHSKPPKGKHHSKGKHHKPGKSKRGKHKPKP